MVPSSVSIVSTQDMIELARPKTCVMPHGSRVSPDGSHHYSACMMSEMLVEIDTRTFGVSRHFMLTKGGEHGMRGSPAGAQAHMAAGPPRADSGREMSHGMTPAKPGETTCSPTWAQPSADGSRVFVACNKANDIVEVDVEKWELKRRIPAGDGVYNLAVTPDGALLLSTNKRGQSVSVIDITTGKELARIATKRPVVHGVAVSTDGKYAFVTEEGLPRDPGTVEMIDLATRKVIASVDVGAQAAGVEFWKTEGRRE
jgi:YVTN family beta-propeller protein